MENIKDLDVSKDMKISELVNQMENTGFQATNLARGIDIVKSMHDDKVTVYLAFTANMVASGLRSVFAKMCEKKLIDVIVTTGGAIEHDLMRSFKPYLIGDFSMDDSALNKKGINRIGNVLVPSDRYILLENKIQPLFAKLHKETNLISPSQLARELGKITNDKNSFLYWATKNNIPIFSPGITDSAIGMQTYFFKQDNPDFGIDVTGDMKALADITLNAEKTGAIVLGGGISKHHVLGANLMREGLDYAVYITTSQPWDGSLSGARTNEAVSWGKIKKKANHVTIDGDATILFPLLISEFM